MAIPDACQKRWRLWQVESAIACNVNCVMCPWHMFRRGKDPAGIMSPEVWNVLRPHLKDAASIDFSGGGEPLLQPMLARWIRKAHAIRQKTEASWIKRHATLQAAASAMPEAPDGCSVCHYLYNVYPDDGGSVFGVQGSA